MESKERLLLDENPQAIADIARKTGATEEEARALLLLERLGEVFDGLPNVITGEKVQFALHLKGAVWQGDYHISEQRGWAAAWVTFVR